jgi:hypothetical protein
MTRSEFIQRATIAFATSLPAIYGQPHNAAAEGYAVGRAFGLAIALEKSGNAPWTAEELEPHVRRDPSYTCMICGALPLAGCIRQHPGCVGFGTRG